MKDKIKVGTRGSALALKQTNMVIAALSNVECEVITIETSGDKNTEVPLREMGGKELFTKEIDQALINGEIDIAVHSLKDIGGVIDKRITIAAVLEREDVRDSIIGAENISSLKSGAKVGTSSPRRKAQLLALRDDLEIVDIRGNVGTRIKKVQSGEYDATILAVAGLKRLGLTEYKKTIPIEEMIPAIGQAAIAITCRDKDLKTQEILVDANHQKTYLKILAERAVLKAFGADCHTPIAANAEIAGEDITIKGFVATDDCSKYDKADITGKVQDAEQLGAQLAELLIAKRDIL